MLHQFLSTEIPSNKNDKNRDMLFLFFDLTDDFTMLSARTCTMLYRSIRTLVSWINYMIRANIYERQMYIELSIGLGLLPIQGANLTISAHRENCDVERQYVISSSRNTLWNKVAISKWFLSENMCCVFSRKGNGSWSFKCAKQVNIFVITSNFSIFICIMNYDWQLPLIV